MILDEKKISELLGNNKEKDKMETDYNKSSVNILPASPYGGGYGGNNNGYNDGRFLELLILLGVVDRNGNKVQNATAEQVQSLASSAGMTAAEVNAKIDRLTLAGCEQTTVMKDTIHSNSLANLAGQTTLGQKITENGFRIESNAKDIEKNILVDGGLTRKNDDDNTNQVRNAQNLSFINLDKSLCSLEHNMGTGFSNTNANIDRWGCEIKSEIKDTKYELSTQAEKNFCSLTTQADKNYHALSTQMSMMEKDSIIREKDDQIRGYESKVQALEYRDLKEGQANIMKELEEDRRTRDRHNEINVNSKNIGSEINSAINNAILPHFREINSNIIAVGNDVNKGIGNTNRN